MEDKKDEKKEVPSVPTFNFKFEFAPAPSGAAPAFGSGAAPAFGGGAAPAFGSGGNSLFGNFTAKPADDDDGEDDGEEEKKRQAKEEEEEAERRKKALAAANILSGEEDEDLQYKQRSRLFRFDKDANQWKERGTGDVKILKHKTTGKFRILLRQDKTGKMCCNHFMYPVSKLSPHVGSDKAFVWSTPGDFADGVTEESLFAIRFASHELAVEFEKAYNVGLAQNESLSKSDEKKVEEKKDDGKKDEEKK